MGLWVFVHTFPYFSAHLGLQNDPGYWLHHAAPKDGWTSYPRGWRRDQHAAKCALARAAGARASGSRGWARFPTKRGQYHRMPSITPRFCELGLIRICPFEKNVSGDFDPPGDPPRCSIAGPPYHHWTCPRVRHRGGKHNCRAMSSTEFFDSERLEWLTLPFSFWTWDRGYPPFQSDWPIDGMCEDLFVYMLRIFLTIYCLTSNAKSAVRRI